ncbi:hypothetical protein CTI12_AA021490 [Artemisia annua]|uniref:RRM domain-containing protein n=1 Tax=Artemisia annua TaxID=35608 RepID=A0A2U1QJI2_ARTAN|nr:hypothetical protein CTI12_AA021490 [Artemisia annua]
MGDNDWIEVRKKHRGSMFSRLQVPQPNSALMDDLAKISLSVYVSNFPSHLTVRELWNICGKKGTIADVFIAKHRNKLGQMFGFCRFIKVSNSENLINSLNKIWIGKLRLHANLARFGRNVGKQPSQAQPNANPAKITTAPKVSHNTKDFSYASVAKNSFPKEGTNSCNDHDTSMSNKPAATLSYDTPNDFPLALLGCYKDFRSIANTRIMCCNEGFLDVDFKYLGGLWVLFDFTTKDARDKFLHHIGVQSWFSTLKLWHDDFVVEERLI